MILTTYPKWDAHPPSSLLRAKFLIEWPGQDLINDPLEMFLGGTEGLDETPAVHQESMVRLVRAFFFGCLGGMPFLEPGGLG